MKPKRETTVDLARRNAFLYQALETEIGGVEVYRMALQCVVNDDLRAEWEKYLGQTEEHVQVVTALVEGLGLDPWADTPGRQVVRHIGKSLVKAMQLALGSCTPDEAELVAAECVVSAETRDHLNWSLLGKLAAHLLGAEHQLLRRAYEQCEDQEDEHLYHSTGWAREMRLAALGLPAVLPPPEEVRKVQNAKQAAEAAESRHG